MTKKERPQEEIGWIAPVPDECHTTLSNLSTRDICEVTADLCHPVEALSRALHKLLDVRKVDLGQATLPAQIMKSGSPNWASWMLRT